MQYSMYILYIYILYKQLDFLYFWPGPFFVAANGKDWWGPLTNIAAMNFVGLLQGGAGPTLHLTRKVRWEEATCLTHYQGQHYVSSTAKQLQRRCCSSICVAWISQLCKSPRVEASTSSPRLHTVLANFWQQCQCCPNPSRGNEVPPLKSSASRLYKNAVQGTIYRLPSTHATQGHPNPTARQPDTGDRIVNDVPKESKRFSKKS